MNELPQNEVQWLSDEKEDGGAARLDFKRPPVGDYSHWVEGMYVRHPTFGAGRLLWKQGSGSHTRAGVRFSAYGEKTLILEYAKMELVPPEEYD